MTSITIELPEQLREKIDEVRGDTPLDQYVLSLLEEQTYSTLEEITPGLSAADHIRLADEAEVGPLMSAEEAVAKVKARFPNLWPEGANR
jgi:predicted transcriptional regulator